MSQLFISVFFLISSYQALAGNFAIEFTPDQQLRYLGHELLVALDQFEEEQLQKDVAVSEEVKPLSQPDVKKEMAANEINIIIRKIIASNPLIELYKTEMCNNWSKYSNCPYGNKCKFAHGAKELRKKHYI